jgi:ankyrin repeat protein
MLEGQFMIRFFVVAVSLLGASGVAHSGPLYDAAGRGDNVAVEKLLGEGAEVDQRGRNAETPLIAAALSGKTATAELLIARGADVMARNKGGLTPLHAAAYSGSEKVVQLLLDHGAKLEDRANVSGGTPLIVAAEENRVGVIELLINHGANVSITDRDGFAVLTIAWMKKRNDIVRLLKLHGATCQPVEILGTAEYYRQCLDAGQ